MAIRFILVAAAICMALIGCKHRPATHPVKRVARHGQVVHHAPQRLYPAGLRTGVGAQPQQTTAVPSPYTLDSGDQLRITVFGQENLSRIYLVDAGGYVSMPLIGAIRARGGTTFQLEERISGALRRKYVKDPKVTVEVQTNRPFFILGEVRNGGQYPYVAGMTVQTAVAIAGGFTPRAKKKSMQLTRQVNGATVSRMVPANWKVQPGDTITVSERFF